MLPYERQLEVKADQVREALERIGRLSDFELEPIVPAVEQWRYRNKLEYSFGTGDAGELVLGFHAPGRWDEIVPMDDCLLASERSNEVRAQVLAWAREQDLQRLGPARAARPAAQPGDPRGPAHGRAAGAARHLAGADRHRLADRGGALRRPVLDPPGAARRDHGRRRDRPANGTPQLRERLRGLDFLISPEAFFQTNTEMAEQLYEVAAEFAQLRGHERVFDLYCGIGTIGLTLAARAREVVGVEIVEPAVADAIENARINDVLNARFYAGDIRLAMRDLVEQAGRPDVAVVDPPRAGLSQKVVRRILEAQPSRIVYVSCNPTTLAPNAAQMVEAGYRLVRVRPVDMFPQTPHIESVALLERG